MQAMHSFRMAAPCSKQIINKPKEAHAASCCHFRLAIVYVVEVLTFNTANVSRVRHQKIEPILLFPEVISIGCQRNGTAFRCIRHRRLFFAQNTPNRLRANAGTAVTVCCHIYIALTMLLVLCKCKQFINFRVNAYFWKVLCLVRDHDQMANVKLAKHVVWHFPRF